VHYKKLVYLFAAEKLLMNQAENYIL